MAQMIPDRPGKSAEVSGAERTFFRRFAEELDKDWTVLHSLGIAGHPTKPWAEIDFVLIGPPGVIVLEAKGGRVERRRGVWVLTRGDGEEFEKREGPWQQVATAAKALLDSLQQNKRLAPIVRSSLFASGVLLPDVPFRKNEKVSSPDVDLNTLYDSDDWKADLKAGGKGKPRGIDAYVTRLTRYWSGRYPKKRPLAASDRVALVKAMRGDFQLVPPLGVVTRNVDAILNALTEDQYDVVDALLDNDRVIVKGGAGTGKTLIAAHEAERLRDVCGDEARIVFTCFNRNLATFLAGELEESAPGVHVRHLHALMDEVIEAAGLTEELQLARSIAEAGSPDDMSRFYQTDMPALALRALETTGPISDVLIIDEGQDLLSTPFADFLNACVSGGIYDGMWRLFMDQRQDIFKHLDGRALGRFREARPAELRLRVNCRNTAQIARATALLSGLPSEEVLSVEGPDVTVDWYSTHEQQGVLAAGHIRRLLEGGLAPHRIALLSRYKLENSLCMQNLAPIPAPVVDLGAEGWRSGAVMFSTITGFKGLEADAVIMMDNSYILRADTREHLDPESYYVGLSRAKSVLVVLIHDRNRTDLEELAARH